MNPEPAAFAQRPPECSGYRDVYDQPRHHHWQLHPCNSGLMGNRLADPRRQHALGTVSSVIDAVARQDRWSIARYCTGPLLDALLAGRHATTFATHRSTGCAAMAGVPIVAVDNDVALVIGGVGGSPHESPIPIAAALVIPSGHPSTWLLASLTVETALGIDVQRAVQFGRFSESEDTEVIAAHSPLDLEAVSIDWDDPDCVLRTTDTGTVTVRDALAELNEFDRKAWPWLAAKCPTFSGLYLRARHPELVRQFTP